jgi:6-phospho-beta-glucosidase
MDEVKNMAVNAKKLVLGVIGGGSIFTPELVKLIADNADIFGEVELRLMDIDSARLDAVGGLCERILLNMGKPVRVSYADNYEDAVRGADFVLVQFRVGGIDARIDDEHLGRKHKIPFTETVTVCGFAAFLRSYYEIEKIAKAVNELAPDAWVLDFANPAGLLSESLDKLGVKKVLGVCNGYIGFADHLKRHFGVEADEDFFISWRGLNHLTFTDRIMIKGENRYDDYVNGFADEVSGFPAKLVKAVGFIPNPYCAYFYMREKIVVKQAAQEKLRSEQVKEIDEALVEEYKKSDCIPEGLAKRGGYGYSRVVVNIIKGIVSGERRIHYAVVRNNGIMRELPDDAFVEVPVMTLMNDLKAMPVEPLPKTAIPLVVTMKCYEQMLIDGAMKRSRSLLYQALMIHPLIGSHYPAEALLADVLEHNAAFLPEME